MKTKISLTVLAFAAGSILAGCGGQNATNAHDVKVLCDSVDQTAYDSDGSEVIVKVLRCDTIKENENN
jgi:ABC-type glycerol-3-phosphate transport system substrate-binding protein